MVTMKENLICTRTGSGKMDDFLVYKFMVYGFMVHSDG